MADWTVCPQCALKHSLRPDGLCPRCHTTVGPAQDAGRERPPEPAVEAARGAATGTRPPLPEVYDGRPAYEGAPGGGTLFASAAKHAGDERLPTGARVAGAILLVNGLARVVELALSPATAGGAGFQPSPVSFLIDLAVGGFLVAGHPKVLPWAKVRVVLGALLLPVLLTVQHQPLLAGLQVAFSVGLMLLLFGDPGRVRLASGLLATGLTLALETVGLLGLATGTSPLARLQMSAGLEAGALDRVQGQACPWEMRAPGGHWYARKPDAARRDNPLADRWLVWPERDAHVLVIVEQLQPGTSIDMERLAEVVLANARRAAPDLKLVDRTALRAGATRLHTTGTVNGLPVESYYGLFTSGPWVFQLVAFSGRERFAAVEPELRSLIESFEPPPAS